MNSVYESDVQGGFSSNELQSPHISVEEESENYARIVAQPLSPGFGITLGNALRRVLLSSLPGAAVTSVRIDEVEHEFSTIQGVREDTLELLLNFKDIRLRALSNRDGKLYLESSGEGQVHAKDIQVAADYEIVNPDLYLATLDTKEAHLTVEFTVEQGRGYLPAGHADGLPIGVIPVDAVFTPVEKVKYHVEHTRVGQVTDFDKLVLEVWTDGTINGVDAVGQAADIMRDELVIFAQMGKPEPAMIERGVGRGHSLPADKIDTPIEDLDLSVRAYNCLKRSGLMTVGAVLEKSEDELLSLRNFGRKSYDELRDKLIERGFLSADAEGMGEAGDLDEEDSEALSPLGAALIQALREAGEDPSELMHSETNGVEESVNEDGLDESQ
jgi:DNA-directed RNA polymerase subunit alpha